MTRTAAISVAISTRDRPQALARCLASLRAGTVLPAEIIVVDQSRGNDTRQLVSGAAGVRYVAHAGSGLGASQNIAFAHAAEAIVAVTDDDCVVDERWLETLERALCGPGAPEALTGRVLPLGPDTPGLYPVSTRQSTLPREFSVRSRPWDVGSGNNFAVRLDWLQRIGGNDERLGPGALGLGAVDMDLFYRLLRARARVRYDPDAVVFHERTTRRGRFGRRFPYGYGVGVMCAVWLRRGDRRAVLILARWLAFRVRRLLRGLRRADLMLAHEEVLVLWGTVCGVIRGARLRDRTPGSPDRTSGNQILVDQWQRREPASSNPAPGSGTNA
ncbi:MAG TPA: glycosyltransferase family 2 protein [Solirubrobacteraceae bacterium]|nr:glycosyltransferase family 2 protein [Solirubrobacteraceae bacterium]